MRRVGHVESGEPRSRERGAGRDAPRLHPVDDHVDAAAARLLEEVDFDPRRRTCELGPRPGTGPLGLDARRRRARTSHRRRRGPPRPACGSARTRSSCRRERRPGRTSSTACRAPRSRGRRRRSALEVRGARRSCRYRSPCANPRTGRCGRRRASARPRERRAPQRGDSIGRRHRDDRRAPPGQAARARRAQSTRPEATAPAPPRGEPHREPRRVRRPPRAEASWLEPQESARMPREGTLLRTILAKYAPYAIVARRPRPRQMLGATIAWATW